MTKKGLNTDKTRFSIAYNIPIGKWVFTIGKRIGDEPIEHQELRVDLDSKTWRLNQEVRFNTLFYGYLQLKTLHLTSPDISLNPNK